MIIAIGEVVWDIFPDRKALGGAPVNVAYHLNALGLDVRVITRVGHDDLGEITMERLAALGLDTAWVQRDDELATGTVNVTFTADNEPSFEIVAPAAWDGIDREEALSAVADTSFSMVFGTLAQRDPRSRAAIRALWGKADTCFYDVNLRPPFTTRELVLDSLAAAHIVKVNEDELASLAKWAAITAAEKNGVAELLRQQYNLRALVVTEGGAGSWLAAEEGFFSVPGRKITVADTVGAGDAFFSAFIAACLGGQGWQACLAAADKRGAWVASCYGATPERGKTGKE
jgi:fructokinase